MFIRDETLGRVMDITMLGPRGVGKTSLLVSLYDQFQGVAGSGGLVMTASDATTRAELQSYRESLRRFAMGVTRDPGIGGNARVRSHLFGLGTAGRAKPQMTLRFTDIPGGLLTQTTPDAETAILDRALKDSGVIFLAVDSPSLMERNGQYNEETNKPELVTDFVRDALAIGGNRLVVLVPLKCEKYVASAGGTRELAAAVRESYQQLIKTVGQALMPSAAVLTVVQTVGSMRFSRFEPDADNAGQTREVFRLSRLGARYSPQDTDQPLRWMLRFAVNAYKNRGKTVGERIGDWWTDADVPLNQALRTFGADCKLEDGFEVLVNHAYLGLPS
ncbi:hypothetical protein [Actinoplanes sp. NPDC051411]|uniref:TRAFAC clade GTPase domain-containing protein n=1 Tax=Actinoplanes sp. NPDC051411 TaxID=3155522 RepID=UPI0034499E17